MSAKLKEFGFINSYDKIFEYLSEKNGENEIKNYFISISSYGDLICFGYENKLVIASLNYSNHSKNLENLYFFTDDDKYSNLIISSILLIPIASKKESSQGSPDWNCICVGFSCGIVKFFDQTGRLIFSQKFSNSRIEQILLQSSPVYNAADILSENLMILCCNSCFQISGNHLFESLNIFKKQLARSHAGFINEDLETFQLCYKKWIFESQENVVNIIFGYETSDCLIDNIFINSYNKGPYASVHDQVSKFINCATVGKNPFIIFYRLPMESDALDMGDLAQAVYSKVKGVISTSISSWLGSSFSTNKTQVVKKPEITNSEIPSRLQLRHLLEETSRKATMIVGCPQYNKYSKLVAMTDDFGRIFLIDIDEGIIIRIWKGYRDAQISITTSTNDRNVNFLLIYAPRRSIIEIWTIPFGERIASFDVKDKNGRLLHVPHGLLGLFTSLKNSQKQEHCQSTFFLDRTGKLSVLEIPFHLSLINSNNEICQDHLVMKHFRNFLREQSIEPNFETIKTEFSLSIRLLKLTSSVDLLINNVISLSFMTIEVIISFLNEIIELLTSDVLVPLSQENERIRLKINCFELISLIKCYQSLAEMHPNKMTTDQEQNIEILLNLTVEDCIRIKKLFNLYNQYHKSKEFCLSIKQNFHMFTDHFVSISNNKDKLSGFKLAKHVLENDILNIGYITFNKCVTGEYSIETILNLILYETKIDLISCFKMCVTYLIRESVTMIMSNIIHIKKLLFDVLMSELPNVTERYQFVQKCLNIAFDICEKSTNLMNSFLLSMIIRVLICELMQNCHLHEPSNFISYLSNSLILWNDTCQRLEDLSIFSCLLKCRPTMNNQFKVSKGQISFDRELTLAHVIEKGKGIFSEGFSKWAFRWSLRFNDINELYKSLGNKSVSIEENMSFECHLNTNIKEIFAILYKQLPHSLEHDTVLVNVAWEYTRLWSQKIQRVEYFQCACEFLDNVGPAAGLVIQGIGGMMWEIHIKTSLEPLFSKDKIDLSKYSLSVVQSIIMNSINFLQILLKSLENLDVMPTFSSETVWQGDKSRSSLIELAVAKEPVTIDTLDIHIQFLYVIQLASIVGLNNFNFMSLFYETRKYFFKSLTKKVPRELLLIDLNQSKVHRMRFLERIISSCISLFSEKSEEPFMCQTVHSIIKLLVDKWLMEIEEIRQIWIINYYKYGLDDQAAMYLDKVENSSLLAANLLKIIGMRIKKEYLLPKSKNYREYYKYVTPQLIKWFQNLDDDPSVHQTVLQKSLTLIDKVLEWLPENSLDFETATCLQTLLFNIEKTKKYIE